MYTTDTPEITPDLIRYLDRMFPEQVPDPDKSNPHVVFGRIQVVRHLKQLQKEQQKNPNVWT